MLMSRAAVLVKMTSSWTVLVSWRAKTMLSQRSSAHQSQGEQTCVPPRLHPGYLCFERNSSLSITPRVNHCVISFHPHHNLMREDSIFAPVLQMRTLRHRRDEDLLTLPQPGVNKQVLPMFNLSLLTCHGSDSDYRIRPFGFTLG